MRKNDYDFLIVGSGMFGSICARELTDNGFRCLVIDKRKHIGGNCYTKTKHNIDIHVYGPHIFHTSNQHVWNYINRFTEFNNFILTPVACYKNEVFSLPFNMWTFSKMWDIKSPKQAKDIIAFQSREIGDPKNLEEQAIKLVGKEIYEKLIKGYTWKQWKKNPKLLPPEIIKRLPVRFSYDNNYFNDKYQGIPKHGYTAIFEKMLSGIEIELGVDFLQSKVGLEKMARAIIYTGPIDEFFEFEYGMLEYKTTKFVHKTISIENTQGCAVMNYTDKEIRETRSIEHRFFTPEREISDKTIITNETPIRYVQGKTEPMYPVNDLENNSKYEMYRKKALEISSKYYFGGRLAEYKYYDMDKVIESALRLTKQIIENKKG